ncbi:DUF1826 domain-containing protein [Oceanimonas sp. NS1]|nr:DUF1826 domain-containing protein [Oceanimonas sp. NS1]
MSITEPTLSHVAPVDVQGGGPAIFTRIYQPDCNLAVWQRSLPADVEGYVQQLLQAGSRISVRELLPPDTVAGALIKQLPDFRAARPWPTTCSNWRRCLPVCLN